ncbi:MAG: nucleoside triphosphate diphosphatase, partial [Thermoleophilaceae bacterium]|nr:nucleoside triphosphate diphosphatase [Thermoleophilaceae bacterium]
MSNPDESGRALARLDDISRRLRVECPWDREQDERSIVPHTVEEAYELADAANRGEFAKMLDELGDVLFQVVFLSILLEERGEGDFAAVAEHCRQKLIRRHPHVFGDVTADSAGEVLSNWDRIKSGEQGREPGVFGEVPENLPGPLYARKMMRRASSAGVAPPPDPVSDHLDADDFESVGDLLFAAVALAREKKVDPELALRSAADRFRSRIEQEESPA